jgi:hypothetical protein
MADMSRRALPLRLRASPLLKMRVGPGTLTARQVRELGDVVLGEFSGANDRLMVLCPSWDLLDGVTHYCFTHALGERGLITGNEPHEAAWAFKSAADWLREGCELTVAAVDVPAELLAAYVLVAAGWSAPAAVEEVTRLSPEFLWTPDREIPLSILATKMKETQEVRA